MRELVRVAALLALVVAAGCSRRASTRVFLHGDVENDSGLKVAKMSGWRAITSRDQVSWRDFVLASGSSGIGAGDDEPRRTSDAINNYALDYNTAEHSSPMDFGGLTFATPSGPRPIRGGRGTTSTRCPC